MSQRRATRVVLRAMVCVVALGLLAAACGGGGGSKSAARIRSTSTSESTTSTASTSSTVPATSTSSSNSTTSQTRPPTTKPRPRREYPGGGPTDPVFPPGDEAYALLAQGKCTELLQKTEKWGEQNVADAEGENTIFLYRGAAEACLQRWSDAKRDFERLTKTPPDFSGKCARAEVFKWLTALIHDRAADQGFSPVYVKASRPSPCPPEGSTETTVPESTSSTRARG